MTQHSIGILAHRGLWTEAREKNTLAALEKALGDGYGIEVDVRDKNGQLVVAHDADDQTAYPFSDLCQVAERFPQACIAINIKSCGLQEMLKTTLTRYAIRHYFTFDMAVPDLMANLRHDVCSFTRQSEYEDPVLYAKAHGVWVDMFETDWFDGSHLLAHAKTGKDLAIVSPELHSRKHEPFWQKLRNILQTQTNHERMTVYLCTDHPYEAYRFFNEN